MIAVGDPDREISGDKRMKRANGQKQEWGESLSRAM